MTNNIPVMIDLVFDVDGSTLPVAHPFALWTALLLHAPQLEEEKLIGTLPLRATENNQGMLLSKRAKLALRLPTTLAVSVTSSLTGQLLDMNGSAIRLGAAKTRPIQPFPTIHAQMVTGATDEVLFVNDINMQLKELGISGKLICGKRHTLTSKQHHIHGFSLVIHDLKPEASLKLQYAGLGGSRRFGCGIFIPYKVISGLSDD